jgi:hypothetical protein
MAGSVTVADTAKDAIDAAISVSTALRMLASVAGHESSIADETTRQHLGQITFAR